MLKPSLDNMNTIKKCFEIIITGNRDESCLAARRVRKLVYSPEAKEKYEDIANLVKNAPALYEKISEDWRQENYVVAISVIYFLHDRDAEPDFLFPWLLPLLLDSNGVIRYASVRMLSHELGPLTVYIRIPDFEPSGLTNLKPKQAEAILFSLFMDLYKLSESVWKPAYKRYKYIDSLPAGPYKSVEMVLARTEELCGTEYFGKLAEQYHRKLY